MARQRSHKVRRRRRGRFRGLYQLLTVLLAAAAVLVACLVFFRVNGVSVEGNSRYTADEVVEASGIQTGDSLVALSKSQIASLIRTKLPYVEAVAIQRKYPDLVVLTVKERAAAASVYGGGSRWLISSQGKLLERAAGRSVVEITGLNAISPYAGGNVQVAEKDTATLGYVVELLTVLEQRELLSQCTALDCTSDVSMTLRYGIYDVKFPRGGDYDYMVRLFLAALADERMPQGVPGTLDLTVTEHEVFFRAAT